VSAGGERDFTWVDGERLVRFGTGALADAPALLASRGFEGYALLTTERARSQAPALAQQAARVLHVQPGPVPEAAAALRPDVAGRPLVALGGGRVIDSAKAIAGTDGLRCAAVPTTLSGAEMTPFHRMPAGVDAFRLVRPSLVVADPGLMASQPRPALAASAMNALAHAIEALYTPMANPVAEMSALRAARLIASGLEQEPPERSRLALGSVLAGYASGSAGFAVHHAVCQTIVRVAGTPHAQTNAVMLPHFVEMMVARAPSSMSALAGAIGASGAETTPSRVSALAAGTGVTTLSELGVSRDRLEEIAAAALDHPALGNTPDPPGGDELVAVLERAL
jgi:maleylacetate reductase